MSDQSGEDQVYLQPFPDGGPVTPVATGIEPVWSRDGRELFVRDGERMMAVEVQAETVVSVGRPTALFNDSYCWFPTGVPNYDVAADGRFLMIRQAGTASTPLNVVLNWNSELLKRVPLP